MNATTSDDPSTSLHCVVQIGFAGSRSLYPDSPLPDVESQRDEAIRLHLISTLRELREKLGLGPRHFLCGISQIAIGADTIFTRACQTSPRPIPQRIFLPQPVDDYLAAAGSEGRDFTDEQQAIARSLLASPHVIQERVVSHSLDRSDRFQETNAELLRVSDVVICLLREEAEDKVGGTNELLRRACAIGKPTLEIRIGLNGDGQPVCRNHWHLDSGWEAPTIPKPLDKVILPETAGNLPSSEEYCVPLKRLVSTQAKLQQRLFKYAAALIITAHILATLCATGALALHGHGGHADDAGGELAASTQPVGLNAEGLIPWLLGIELLLLTAGIGIHQYLHHSKASRLWANARVVAELSRSLQAISPRHLYLEHLFRLPLPHRFRALLRTLSVLHLRSTRTCREDAWEGHRDGYIQDRIEHQIDFYTTNRKIDERRLKFFQRWFWGFSLLAIAGTAIKLVLLLISHANGQTFAAWPQLLGTLAIISPVLAVAGLSWLAALDCEARAETFEEARQFLVRQKPVMAEADTGAEFDRLVIETETVLLGEVANWFSRRANTGVT